MTAQTYKIYIEDIPKRAKASEIQRVYSDIDCTISIDLQAQANRRFVTAIITTESWFTYNSILSTNRKLHGRHLVCSSEMKGQNSLQDEKRRLYIVNIPMMMRDEDLRALFEYYGRVEHAYIVRKGKMAGMGKLFGFVKFRDVGTASKLVEMKHIKMISGHTISCFHFGKNKATSNKHDQEGNSSTPANSSPRNDLPQKKSKTLSKLRIALAGASYFHSDDNIQFNQAAWKGRVKASH